MQDELKELGESAEKAKEVFGENLTVDVDIIDESELNEDEFTFSLEDIQDALKIPIRVYTFANPNDANKPFKVAMRQLTAEEHAEIYKNAFSPEILKGALVDNGGKPEVDADAALDNYIESMSKTEGFQQKNAQAKYRSGLQVYGDAKKENAEVN